MKRLAGPEDREVKRSNIEGAEGDGSVETQLTDDNRVSSFIEIPLDVVSYILARYIELDQNKIIAPNFALVCKDWDEQVKNFLKTISTCDDSFLTKDRVVLIFSILIRKKMVFDCPIVVAAAKKAVEIFKDPESTTDEKDEAIIVLDDVPDENIDNILDSLTDDNTLKVFLKYAADKLKYFKDNSEEFEELQTTSGYQLGACVIALLAKLFKKENDLIDWSTFGVDFNTIPLFGMIEVCALKLRKNDIALLLCKLIKDKLIEIDGFEDEIDDITYKNGYGILALPVRTCLLIESLFPNLAEGEWKSFNNEQLEFLEKYIDGGIAPTVQFMEESEKIIDSLCVLKCEHLTYVSQAVLKQYTTGLISLLPDFIKSSNRVKCKISLLISLVMNNNNFTYSGVDCDRDYDRVKKIALEAFNDSNISIDDKKSLFLIFPGSLNLHRFSFTQEDVKCLYQFAMQMLSCENPNPFEKIYSGSLLMIDALIGEEDLHVSSNDRNFLKECLINFITCPTDGEDKEALKLDAVNVFGGLVEDGYIQLTQDEIRMLIHYVVYSSEGNIPDSSLGINKGKLICGPIVMSLPLLDEAVHDSFINCLFEFIKNYPDPEIFRNKFFFHLITESRLTVDSSIIVDMLGFIRDDLESFLRHNGVMGSFSYMKSTILVLDIINELLKRNYLLPNQFDLQYLSFLIKMVFSHGSKDGNIKILSVFYTLLKGNFVNINECNFENFIKYAHEIFNKYIESNNIDKSIELAILIILAFLVEHNIIDIKHELPSLLFYMNKRLDTGNSTSTELCELLAKVSFPFFKFA